MRSCLLGATNSSELITRGPFRPFPSLFRMWSGLAPRYANRANLPHVGLESLQLRQDEREHDAPPGGEIRRICAYLLLPVPALSNGNESSFRTYQIRRRHGVRFADWADLPDLGLDTYNAWKTGRKQECAGSKIRRIHANLRDQYKSG